jgi:hypothetical protein
MNNVTTLWVSCGDGGGAGGAVGISLKDYILQLFGTYLNRFSLLYGLEN